MTGTGCTPEGDTLRKLLPGALETGCEKCSESQKALGSKALRYLVKEKPKLWEELMDKFDSEKKYRTKYADKLKELN
ncbi:hypothetical protein WA026_018530 [Henosepilachna vigintioctopunctata]|uniref:Chemosensory protein n=1 Tax=Henosepilachna vigintioctopunctata TaxID=420089 RepID=A0AAW1U9N6_9CUCU